LTVFENVWIKIIIMAGTSIHPYVIFLRLMMSSFTIM